MRLQAADAERTMADVEALRIRLDEEQQRRALFKHLIFIHFSSRFLES